MGRREDLGPHFEDFVKSQIESGRYDDEREVIRAALRLLERQEHAHVVADTALEAMIDEAEADFAAGRVYTLDEAFDSLEAHFRDKSRQQG